MLDTNGWAVFCQLGPMEGQLWTGLRSEVWGSHADKAASLGREPVRKQVWKEHGYAVQNFTKSSTSTIHCSACDMPQPFLARVGSRCAKFRATDPSNKSSLELQPRIGSYVESGYRVWPYRHYDCTGAQLQNKRLVARWHRRISVCFWWTHFCSEKLTCWQRRLDSQIVNDNQYPELHVWNRLQTTCNPTICDPIPFPLPW